VPCASRAPDAVDVVVNISGEVEVDHVDHVGDVETARRNVRSHQDGRAASAERG